MKKVLLGIIGLLLIFSFGQTVTSCIDEEPWVEIIITNDSKDPINIIITKEKDESGRPNQTHTYINNVPAEESAQHDGDSGTYKISITVPNPNDSPYFFPRGGEFYSNMAGLVKFTFDGERLIRADWDKPAIGWAEIYITNDDKNDISIELIFNEIKDGGILVPKTVINRSEVKPDDFVRYEGYSGSYRFTITDSDNNKYHHPMGGSNFLSMSQTRKYSFDGMEINNY